jgi:type II secretion system protein G
VKCRAFTLIELLIVVAIIAILAAIAVPNFLEAQVRSKVSRVRNDLRAIATALESYSVDNLSRYPWVNQSPGYAIPPGPDPGGLTTPVAYMTSVPTDPFGGQLQATDPYSAYNQTEQYYYATLEYFKSQPWGGGGTVWQVRVGGVDGPRAAWALQSKGPDLHWAHNTFPPGVQELDYPNLWQYDPTNGTVSIGNILRAGP